MKDSGAFTRKPRPWLSHTCNVFWTAARLLMDTRSAWYKPFCIHYRPGTKHRVQFTVARREPCVDYRGASLTRKRTPLEPYRRSVPRFLGGSYGGWVFSYEPGTHELIETNMSTMHYLLARPYLSAPQAPQRQAQKKHLNSLCGVSTTC